MQNLSRKLLITLSLTPTFLFASSHTFQGLVYGLIDIIQAVIPLIISLTLLYFLWGLAKFILNAGSGNEMEEAKNTMFWGVIALFVMTSVWGLVAFLKASFISG